MTKSVGLEKYGFMMVFGGSLGNIFDRLYYSSVPDFIDIHFNNFHWFIFNVADIFITLGLFLLIYLEIFCKKKI
jgi:signal peptidase II